MQQFGDSSVAYASTQQSENKPSSKDTVGTGAPPPPPPPPVGAGRKEMLELANAQNGEIDAPQSDKASTESAATSASENNEKSGVKLDKLPFLVDLNRGTNSTKEKDRALAIGKLERMLQHKADEQKNKNQTDVVLNKTLADRRREIEEPDDGQPVDDRSSTDSLDRQQNTWLSNQVRH